MAIAAACLALVSLWSWIVGAGLLDDERAPLAARLIGGISLQIGGFVLALAALAVGIGASL